MKATWEPYVICFGVALVVWGVQLAALAIDKPCVVRPGYSCPRPVTERGVPTNVSASDKCRRADGGWWLQLDVVYDQSKLSGANKGTIVGCALPPFQLKSIDFKIAWPDGCKPGPPGTNYVTCDTPAVIP